MTHRKHSHAFGTITLTVTACLLLLTFQEVVSQLNPKLNACLYSANRTLIS